MSEEYIKRRIEISKEIVCIRVLSPGQLMQILFEKGLYKKKHCLMCGDPLTGRRTSYCSEQCSEDVFNYYNQNYIRTRLINERGWRCEGDCGTEWKEFPDETLELHHKIPIHDGGTTFDDDNLILLCTKCHGKDHQDYNKKKKQKVMTKKQDQMDKYWKSLDEKGNNHA